MFEALVQNVVGTKFPRNRGCDWEIEEVAEVAEGAFATPRPQVCAPGKLDRPVKYRFPPFEYFGHTGFRLWHAPLLGLSVCSDATEQINVAR